MATTKKPQVLIPGTSATGTKHDVLIEVTEDGFQVTIVGVNGKRHASAKIEAAQSKDITAFFAKHKH